MKSAEINLEIKNYSRNQEISYTVSEVSDPSYSKQAFMVIILCISFRYDVMLSCWKFTPEDRPSFDILSVAIGQQLQ